MRDIEGIEEVVEKLKPHFAAIEEHFEHENRIFIDLISSTHDTLGRVLKCHLVVEHYLDRFLVAHFEIDNFDHVRLSFAQKTALLPNSATAAAFVKPGILQLNKIRNRFGHSLGAELSVQDLGAIRTVLDIARPGFPSGSLVEAIGGLHDGGMHLPNRSAPATATTIRRGVLMRSGVQRSAGVRAN